ncbi:hypothetical protein PENANT_c013G08078 [Penicillium antarcticum]|uniref:Uncharacterized protein n=1 Tax=Penicillium antarcticum TaxID=416450 RepID=A0A1V6Q5B8_9EURO|nr:hypothetical protein PENANT_c013G08078 [Penicillium antarcticum]
MIKASLEAKPEMERRSAWFFQFGFTSPGDVNPSTNVL